MSVFCTNCGKEVDENAFACPNCGVQVNSAVSSNTNIDNKNDIAIVGFIFAFLIAEVGLALSIVGLKRATKTNINKGLSIAGIVISSIKIVIEIYIVIAYLSLI